MTCLYANQPRYTIIDEADEMLQSDWEEELRKIMAGGGKSALPPYMFLIIADSQYQIRTRTPIMFT